MNDLHVPVLQMISSAWHSGRRAKMARCPALTICKSIVCKAEVHWITAAAGQMQILRHMHLHFLTPLPKLMAELMALLEDHRILAPVDLFFPVYPLNASCRDEEGDRCHTAEDRSGVTIQESLIDRRQLSILVFLILKP